MSPNHRGLLLTWILFLCGGIGLASGSARAAEQAVKIDFDTPRLQQKILGADPTPVPSPAAAAAASGALVIEQDHVHLSAGERLALVRTRMDLAKHPNVTLVASLYRIGEDKPVATSEQKASFERAWIWTDVRSSDLSQARLALALRDGGGKTVGAAELLLSAEAPAVVMTPGQRIEVKIDVPQGLGLPAGQAAVTFGFPVPAGAVWDAEHLRIVDRAGRPVPFQREVTGRWNKDGAVQWVRFDAVVKPADGCFVEYAADAVAQTAAPSPVKMTQRGNDVILETAGVSYTLGADHSPIREVRLGEQVVATCKDARGLYVVDQTGRVGTASAKDATVQVEAAGPVAASVRIEGPYLDPGGKPLARHVTRIELFAGQPAAKVTHTLVLVNDSNEVWFKDVGWAMKTSVGAAPVALFNRSRETASDVVEQPLAAAGASAWMLQDSHIRYQAGTNHFTIASQQSSAAPKTIAEGDECGDWAALKGAQAMLVVGCREAARQHPKEFAFTSDGFDLKLFSSRAGEELDFRVESRMKIWNLSAWFDSGAVSVKARPGGEDRVRQIPSNAIGWSKTHELTFAPLPASAKPVDAAAIGQVNSQGVFASVDPAWIYQSRAMGPLHPRDPERFPAEEKLLEQTFQWWDGRGPHVGEWGFVDAFAGPHMAYRGKAGFPMMRRFPLSYTVRRDLWLLYARSGDRDIRRMNSDSVRTYMDGAMARWDGNGKVRGLYISEGDGGNWSQTRSPESVPLYWQGKTPFQTGGTSDLDTFYWFYQLTGYRRAREAITEYGDAVLRNWTPEHREYRAMRLLLQVAQCYAYLGDESYRIIAEKTLGDLYAPEGYLRIAREKPYGSGYKMQSDTVCVDFAWQALRDPRANAMRDAVYAYYPDEYLGQLPTDYGFPMGRIAPALYEQTQDPALALGAVLSNRLAVISYNPAAGAFGTMTMASPFVRGIFEGIPYHQHLIAQTDADRKTLASFAAFDATAGGPLTLVFQKGAGQDLHLRVIDPRQMLANPIGQAGGANVPLLQVWQAGDARVANMWTLGYNAVTHGRGETTHVRVPYDAPEGTYALSNFAKGQITVIANGVAPMLLEAPEGFTPLNSVQRVYFKVPENAERPRLFVEKPARLLAPDGKPFKDGQAVQDWIDLPANQPGVWGIELAEPGRIQVERLPARFVFQDPALYFDPPARLEVKGAADD